MRAGFALFFAVVLFAAGCVTPPETTESASISAVAGTDAEGFAPILFGGLQFEELDLATTDGLRLHADVYLPVDPTDPAAPEAFPTILLLSPYWGGGTQGDPEFGYMPYDFLVKRLLPRGYAVVYGDLAGNGGSSGCWDFMGPVERASAIAMVDAIAAQPWSDGKVGMMGISYDGMTQIMAASGASPNLVTIVPAAPLTEAYKGLIQNGVHYGGGWHSTITGYESSTLQGPGANPERVPGWLETVADSPACMADNHQGAKPTNEYSPYFEARDYRPLGADVTASVFYIQGFFDPAVKPDNLGEWFDHVPTLKKAWLGYWYHQYPNAAGGGRDDMYVALHRWFDHELKGIDNGIELEPAIDVQDAQGRWRHEAAWPPADVNTTRYQLGADGMLAWEGAKSGPVTFGGATSATNLAMPTGMGTTKFTTTVETPLHIAGQPTLDITLASDRPVGTVIARLYDGERMISQGAYNLLYADGLATARTLSPGQAVTVSVQMYPTDWPVDAGSELRLVLSTVDSRNWYDSDAGLATLTLEAGETAVLTLPTVVRTEADTFLTSCGRSLKDTVKGCWKDLEDIGVEE